MRNPLTDKEKDKIDAELERRDMLLKSFKRSRHYKLVMELFTKEFEKNSLEAGLKNGMTNLEQIGMIDAIQAEAKQRFNRVKSLIEGI